jgi:tetratricopeptide (TPR) repeat protein
MSNDTAEVANIYMSKLVKFMTDDPMLIKELERVDREFPLLNIEETARKITIFDWFIFDYKLKAIEKIPLDYFIELNTDMSDKEKEIYETFRQNVYGFFEIKAIKMGKEMVLIDLFDKKKYWVWDRTSTQNFLKNQCIFTRVLPYQDHYILSGVVNAFPLEATYMLRLGYKRIRENKLNTRITPKEVAKIFSSFEKEKKPQKLDLDTLKERLERKLKNIGLLNITSLNIIEMFNKNMDPCKVFKEFNEKAIFPDEKDADRFLDLLIAFWNKVPQQRLGGVSPEDKSKIYCRGFQEKVLIKELMAYLQNVIKPNVYANKKALDRAVVEIQKKWLNTKNPELDGMCPGKIILEERKRLGNPLKKIEMKVVFQSIPITTQKEKEIEELFNTSLNLTKVGCYKEAVEKYKCYLEFFPENYIAWGNIGMLYGLLLNRKKALKCVRKALSLNPNYKIAKDNLEVLENVSREHLKNLAKNKKIRWLKKNIPARRGDRG